VSEAGRGSVTILQRKLRVGYNRANRLVEQLEAAGILGPDRGRSQGREVYLKTAEESEKEPGAEIPSPLTASPPPDLDNEVVNGRASGSGSVESGHVESGQAGLPPPPEKDDAPPRIWM